MQTAPAEFKAFPCGPIADGAVDGFVALVQLGAETLAAGALLHTHRFVRVVLR